MQVFTAICTGLGLSAACGLRVFLPLFIFSIAVRASTGGTVQWVHVPEGVQWMGDTPALVLFGVATVIEIIGFLFPWVDHVLDLLAAPLSAAAGALLMTCMMLGVASGPDAAIHPAVAWSLGIIAGAATATGVETASIAGRVSSSVLTIGWLNPIYAFIESALALILGIIAIVVPLLAGLLVMFLVPIFMFAAWRLLAWRRKQKRAHEERLRKARERIAANMAQRAAAGS